jgi:hypothetical protein
MQHHVKRVANAGIDRFTPRLAKNESAAACTDEILAGAAALPFNFSGHHSSNARWIDLRAVSGAPLSPEQFHGHSTWKKRTPVKQLLERGFRLGEGRAVRGA